ncbi:MAG: hypothetical protein CBC09_05265 [Cellvibrionales bacterium TMED49]|nr:hypothetical protein [Porticoccaceae bacterium]OUU38484.1 MAG: hypothetical protein CBC09_05265 [Cellvibrionales bacterium TMED49]|tara:strand:+ start:116 stop:880 length:765 start_codon:yes stop_codon:yes gene_type:complete
MVDRSKGRMEPIVPQRDGVTVNPSSATRSNGRSTSIGAKTERAGMSLIWKVISAGFFMITMTGIGFGLREFSVLQFNHNQLLQRFEELESRLNVADESLVQSGAALQLKISDQQDELQKHWSEIKKLWGVANDRNKNTIAKNQTDITFLATRRVANEEFAGQLEEKLRVHTKRLEVVSAKYLEISADLTSVFNQIRVFKDDQNKEMELIKLVELQLKNHQEAIESMDGFRRNINQKIYQLEQQKLKETGAVLVE